MRQLMRRGFWLTGALEWAHEPNRWRLRARRGRRGAFVLPWQIPLVLLVGCLIYLMAAAQRAGSEFAFLQYWEPNQAFLDVVHAKFKMEVRRLPQVPMLHEDAHYLDRQPPRRKGTELNAMNIMSVRGTEGDSRTGADQRGRSIGEGDARMVVRLPRKWTAGGEKGPTVELQTGKTASLAESLGELWGARARQWAEVQEGTVRPLYEAVLRKTAIGHGTALLDIGCGSGMFCEMAAKTGARVAGIDAAPALLVIARERVPQGDFREGEMENLPFPDTAFDVVTGFNSFQYAVNPVNALREACRVARREATIVIA